MSDTQKTNGLNISTKSFITAIAVIFALMLATYLLTIFIPGGEYTRCLDENGNSIIDVSKEYKTIDGGLPFWKWILSPFLCLASDGGFTIVAVLIFILVIGACFSALNKCNLMSYMLNKIVAKYEKKRYVLMALVILLFMAMGTAIGSFEECVPLVPIAVSLSIGLGWDALTGIGISLLAAGCGFATGICNPFTVGVAQGLAGIPIFSGMWLRMVSFVLIYGLLFLFIFIHARRIEKSVTLNEDNVSFKADKKMEKSLRAFVIIILMGIAAILSSSVFTFLRDYTMIIVSLAFLLTGIICPLIIGLKGKELLSSYGSGILSLLPAVLMVLMASSIKYTMVEGHILDSILHSAIGIAGRIPKMFVILFIYLIVLVMNFFIASGSAKAFLLIPLIIPIAQIFGISPQLCVLAYAFGDGFSNVFYPTNPVLLISLGIADVSYGKWASWTWKFQAVNIVFTSLILLFGLAIGYR